MKKENDIPYWYEVTFEDGWAIIAADRRVSPVIANSKTDKTDEYNPTFDAYLDIIKRKLLSVRCSSKIPDNSYIEYWQRILIPNQNFYQIPEDVIPDDSKGYQYTFWVLSYVKPLSTRRDTLSFVDHLIPTQWGQAYPWNVFLPLGRDGYKCITGCTMVAMSQILYYWNRRSGVPATYKVREHENVVDKYDHITVTGTYNSDPQWWNYMPLKRNFADTSGSHYVSRLMLDVGCRVGAVYSSAATGAWIQPSVFKQYGLSCTESRTYDSSKVIDNLDCGWPVAMSGFGDDGGHSWVIDSYLKFDTYEENEYVWRKTDRADWTNNDIVFTEYLGLVTDFGGDYPVEGKHVIKEVFSGQDIVMKVNWGWNGLHDETELDYSYSSGWLEFSDDPHLYYNIHVL